jgi:hypothetical protein
LAASHKHILFATFGLVFGIVSSIVLSGHTLRSSPRNFSGFEEEAFCRDIPTTLQYCLPFIRTYAQTGGAEAARTKLGMRLLGVTTWYSMQLGAILAEEMVQRAWKEVEKHLPLGKGSIICCRL